VTSSGTAGQEEKIILQSGTAGKVERSRVYQRVPKAQHFPYVKDTVVFSGTASQEDVNRTFWQSHSTRWFELRQVHTGFHSSFKDGI